MNRVFGWENLIVFNVVECGYRNVATGCRFFVTAFRSFLSDLMAFLSKMSLAMYKMYMGARIISSFVPVLIPHSSSPQPGQRHRLFSPIGDGVYDEFYEGLSKVCKRNKDLYFVKSYP